MAALRAESLQNRSIPRDAENTAVIKFSECLSSRGALSMGSAGSKDGLVNEMLKLLPFNTVLEIWVSMNIYLKNGLGAGEYWRFLELVGLPKLRVVKGWEDYRYLLHTGDDKIILKVLQLVIHNTGRTIRVQIQQNPDTRI